jgi:hypothetical protein
VSLLSFSSKVIKAQVPQLSRTEIGVWQLVSVLPEPDVMRLSSRDMLFTSLLHCGVSASEQKIRGCSG